MDKIELLGKNKNKILNLGIIILALFFAFQNFKGSNEQLSALNTAKDNEVKKNKAFEEIADLEVKIDKYKKAFTKKDISYTLDVISKIAKNTSVKFISIKPIDEETNPDYVKSSFLITVRSADYHSLSNFISQIEATKDIYLVGEARITSENTGFATQDNETPNAEAGSSAEASSMLVLNLKISTIFINE
jgi:hypothetical protein